MSTAYQTTAYTPPSYNSSYQSNSIELAGRFIRLIAYIFDVIIVLITAIPLYLAFVDFAKSSENSSALAQLETEFDKMAETGKASPELTEAIGDMFYEFASSPYFDLYLFCTFVYLAYGLYLIINGQTIGKKIFGIRVVRSDGSRAGFWRCVFIRWFIAGLIIQALTMAISLVPIIGWIIGPFVGLIGLLMIFGETRRCLHDRIADTLVINVN